jgi:amino acid adenylation domain-containing protein
MPGTIALKKELDSHRLEKAFKQLVKRHESFRTSFEIVNDEPIQKVHDHVEFAIEYSNLALDEQNRESRDRIPGIERMIRTFVYPFDLSKTPLLRVGLIRAQETNILLVDIHHIISDGVSHRILEEELIKMYNGEELPELRWQYKDYSEWYNRPEKQRKVKNQEKHWLDCLSGDLPVLNLPCDYLRPAVQRFEGNSINFELSEKETEGIKELAKITGTTLYMVTLSIYNILLSKLGGQEDIIVGTPIAARRHPDLERIIGMFVNTLAMRNFPSGDKTFKEFLKEVKKRTLNAYENQEYQFEDLVDQLSIRRDTSRNPIFDVAFNFFDQEESKNDFANIEEENNYRYQNKTSKFDQTLRAMDLGETLFFNLEYSTDLFAHKTIVKVIGYFKQIVDGITSCPDGKISDIEIIPGDIRKEKLDYFNEDLNREGEIKTIQVKLNDSFQKYKNNIAVEYGNTQLTYWELEGKSACIANRLMVDTVKRGSFIGIYMEDKIEVISAIIGILNAGCVFVPLDSKLPVKRIEHMIQAVDIRMIFTDAGNGEILSHFSKNFLDRTQRVVLDNLFYKMAGLSVSHNAVQDVRYSSEDKAYVYFTSGSTGMPQAIIGKNGSLVQFIEWEVETFSVDETYRISQLAAVGFDAFLRNVFTPLLVGGTVCIPGTRELVMDSEGLVNWIDGNRITLVHCVPSVFRLINSEILTTGRFSHLKYILMSGEQISPNELRRWYDVFGHRIQLVNCYGATETTVIRTFHFIREGDIQMGRIPAGRTIGNSRVIILDRNMNICPQGIVGEIYVRTPYRSFGYLNAPELTAERFIKNPFNGEEEETDIIFKSGDLGRELENGDIEILGRMDRQVKIRGVRIEPESIENCLLKHQKIDKSVVIARRDENGENYLCAYIVNNVNKKQEAAGNSIAGEKNGYGYRLEASLKSECKENKIFFSFDFVDDDYCQNKTILELFKDQALKNPDQVVILSKDDHITFRALNEKVNRLSILLNKNGAKGYIKVGILLEKTSDIITGMAGITKAGGEFFLIDPRLPSDRIVSIMKGNTAFLLLTDGPALEERSFTVLQDIQSGRAPLEITSPRKAIANLNELPIPDRSKVDYEKYTKFIGQSLIKNSITLLGARGCPFKCAYCHKIWPKKQISRSAENIFNELQLYYNIGFRRFVFLDDIFNLDVGNTVRFFEMIIERGLDIQICLNLRGDILTKDYIDLMVKTGVIRCAFALETASPRLQKLIRKNLNLQRFKENMEYISSVHPQVILEINTMHGFPTETEEEAMATLKFIKDLKWVHFPYINILKIYPNTDMEKLALANGISQESIDKSASLAYHELPDTLPFDKSFTLKYQMELMSDYFLLKERLLQVLPYQLEVLTQDEIAQKYNSYLPVDINSFDDLLKFTNISKDELDLKFLKNESHLEIPNLNRKIKGIFPSHTPSKDALRVLLLDLSQFFTADSGNILYDVVEAPLGLMYLMAYLNSRYKGKIHGKIAKSRIDFDNFAELKGLLDEFKPDLIGIRTLTYFKEFFHKSISMMRQWGVDVPIIAGGPYATSDYKTILQDKHVDLAVLGEGEEALSQLLGAMIENQGKLPAKKDLKNIQGIAFVSRGEHVEEGSTNEIIMLDAPGIRAGSYAYDSRSRQISGNQMDPAAAVLYPTDTGNALTPSELREYLAKVFPDYMIPSYFVPIENIPLTLNRKIDWRRLPEPGAAVGDDYAAPTDELEEKLVEIWSEVLKINKDVIGIRSNFFNMGGHSLSATILVSKIHKKLDTKILLVEVFRGPTIEELVQSRERNITKTNMEEREEIEL